MNNSIAQAVRAGRFRPLLNPKTTSSAVNDVHGHKLRCRHPFLLLYFNRSRILSRPACAQLSSSFAPGAPAAPIPPMTSSPNLITTPPPKNITCGSLASGAIEVLAFGVLGQSERVVAKRDSRIGFIVGAIERVDAGTVAAQGCDRGAVGIEHDRGFVVALPRTGGDHFARRFGRERGGNAMRRQRLRQGCRNADDHTRRSERHFLADVFHDASPRVVRRFRAGGPKFAN